MAATKRKYPDPQEDPQGDPVPAPQAGEVQLAGAGACIELCPEPMVSELPSGWPPAPLIEAPVIASISPNTAVHTTGPDLTMTVTGSHFKPWSVIVFNGGDEPTTFVSETSLTTGVKPSTAGVAGAFPVEVRNGSVKSNSKPFTFTAPP